MLIAPLHTAQSDVSSWFESKKATGLVDIKFCTNHGVSATSSELTEEALSIMRAIDEKKFTPITGRF